MKTLIVCNSEGNIVFTQTNAQDEYTCLVEDIEDTKEPIGVDLETNKCILVERLATTEEKRLLKVELEQKNTELLTTKEQLVNKENELVSTREELVYKGDKLISTVNELEAKSVELVGVQAELLNTQAILVETTYNDLMKDNGGMLNV